MVRGDPVDQQDRRQVRLRLRAVRAWDAADLDRRAILGPQDLFHAVLERQGQPLDPVKEVRPEPDRRQHRERQRHQEVAPNVQTIRSIYLLALLPHASNLDILFTRMDGIQTSRSSRPLTGSLVWMIMNRWEQHVSRSSPARVKKSHSAPESTPPHRAGQRGATALAETHVGNGSFSLGFASRGDMTMCPGLPRREIETPAQACTKVPDLPARNVACGSQYTRARRSW